jgi:hypothetical protein
MFHIDKRFTLLVKRLADSNIKARKDS